MMAASAQHRILRIGVIQGGKIIEERLIKRRESVTIGHGPKNTIVLPASGLPETFTLFELKGGQYALGFSDEMDGKVSLSDTAAADFATLKQSGQARARGNGTHAVLLPETARGKVQVGEVTILFQYVTPPPEPPRPMLPASARGGIFAATDRLFLGAVVGMLIVNYTITYFIWQRPVSESVTLEEMPDRFVKMIMPDKPNEPPPPPEEKKEETPTPKEEPKVAQKPESGGNKGPATKEDVEKKVSKAGLLAVLGSDAEGQGGIQDVLSDGATATNVANALDGATRIDAASADSLAANLKGGGSGKAADINSLGTSGVGAGTGLGPKKDVLSVKVDTVGGPEVESSAIDRGLVNRIIKAHLRAVQACYEKELKRNPTLKGKVVIRFTIGVTGRVTDAEIDENSVNAEVASCIRTNIKFITFPVKLESEVSVSFPFIFSASSG